MPSHVHYRHRQFAGAFAAMLLGATLATAAVFFTMTGSPMLFFLPVVIVFVVLLIFHSLLVEIDEESLRLSFGIGIIRKRIPIAEMHAVREVRNRWWYGFGIRWIPRGILFNVSGLDAVEIDLGSGRRVRIGTDEPGALRAAIESAMQAALLRRTPIDIRD